jgi:hypothetical protein
MARVKDMFMEIESLVWESLAMGAKTKEDVFSYVDSNLAFKVDRGVVYNLVDSADEWPDDELYACR